MAFAHSIRDLKVTLSTLTHIVGSIENISPEYVSKLDMASLTTLVVENLFAEMRDGNDMPRGLQFAHRLSSTLREHLKRNTKCSFNYFTSSSAFYSKQLGFLPFSTIPTMSKPEKDSKVTSQQLGEMRKWREEFGRSVRQVTVRNKSAKDNPCTLPINCYFAKPSEPQAVDFDNLLSMASASDEEDPVASSSSLFCKDAFVVIKPGYQPSRQPEAPFFLGKCKNNVKASERKLTVSIYAQDQLLLPFNFVDAQLQCQIDINSILLKAENVRIEDDVVVLDEDEYSSCVIDFLEYGDQTTTRESAEIGEDVLEDAGASNEVVQVQPSETTVQTTRSGRTPRPRDQSLYLFYD